MTIPFAEQTFNKILTVNTLYFWPQPARLLAEICRVLKTGGYVCLTFSDKSFMQTLPFSNYGFTLYDVAAVMQLTQSLPLNLLAEDHQQDRCISKTGQLVKRDYVSLLFSKG